MHVGNAKRLHDIKNEDLSEIGMDDVSKFDLMSVIGESMTEYIMNTNQFTRDLNDTPTQRDELITAYDNTSTIQANVSNPGWIDDLPS